MTRNERTINLQYLCSGSSNSHLKAEVTSDREKSNPVLMAASDDLCLWKGYIECIQPFDDFLFSVQRGDCRITALGQVSIPELLEKYGRIQIWGDQTNVELRRGVWGSLDDTLRNDSELKCVVHDIFGRLRGILTQGRYFYVHAVRHLTLE